MTHPISNQPCYKLTFHKGDSKFSSDLNHIILDEFLRLGVDDEDVNLDHEASSTNQPRQGSIAHQRSHSRPSSQPRSRPKEKLEQLQDSLKP